MLEEIDYSLKKAEKILISMKEIAGGPKTEDVKTEFRSSFFGLSDIIVRTPKLELCYEKEDIYNLSDVLKLKAGDVCKSMDAVVGKIFDIEKELYQLKSKKKSIMGDYP